MEPLLTRALYPWTTEMIILVVILIVATYLYLTDWLATETTSALAIATLALTGILNTGEALSGFASTATLTVGAMFVISGRPASHRRIGKS